MSIKSIIAVILAMCGSFTTILAVVGYAAQPAPTINRRPTTSTVVSPRSQPELRQPERLAPPTRATSTETASDRFVPDVPAGETAPPLPEIVPADLVTNAEGALSPEQIRRLAAEASTRLEGVESSLSQQVLALKKSRDAMLDQLAIELKGQAPSAAATLLLSLDDELAALALKRLSRAQQNSILDQIPGKRHARLQKRLR
ncbi:MAG: hypothetical protein CME13_02995 [Gemmatimonadetes bacterium]|jgi:hypothetical protein|nr:hypothetical protein [Gemmatimonadota bacterium]MDP7362513.1 hypothetical protein [Candidatus Latescibacterota bacterium]MDP7635841.1 hypothetical protein [Candidatus Latescibacterota bacterium]HCV23579.1 hypothetical protein [Candidatus Latescibacterota bacterium]|tara:strand:+ start:2748 stop:3350 length:603 start_codon:yes stop_codon:yes gene_type:complete